MSISEFIRFCINGGVATLIHFLILAAGIELIHMPSAGAANALASIFGISASFLGNRWFVFKKTGSPILAEFAKFGAVYALIAVLHGLILFFWTDRFELDYRLGFILAAVVQVVLSYSANKFLVFK